MEAAKSKSSTTESILVSDKNFNDTQLQLLVMQDRDDTMQLTEDMESELLRLSNGIDHYEKQVRAVTQRTSDIKKRKYRYNYVFEQTVTLDPTYNIRPSHLHRKQFVVQQILYCVSCSCCCCFLSIFSAEKDRIVRRKLIICLLH